MQYERSKSKSNYIPETVTLYLDGYAVGKNISFIIDSGAAATLVSKRFWLDIPENVRPSLQTSNEKLIFADGDDHAIEGRCSMVLTFGMLEVEHSVIVADVDVMGLLGNDFMRAHSCQLDFENKTLTMEGHEMRYREEIEGSRTCRIKVAETTTVPAGHEMIVHGRVIQRGSSMLYGTVEASSLFPVKHGLFLGRALVQCSPYGIPIRVMNPTEEPRMLIKGTVIGLLHPILGVQTSPLPQNKLMSNSDRMAENCHVPSHLEDLYMRSSVQLAEEEKQRLGILLRTYSDVFSVGDHDLGCTNLVRHHINTGDGKPIKQPPRRLPIHQRDEADMQVRNMLDRGVIVKSTSPWASPIVLVKKKDNTLRFCIDYRRLNEATIKDAYPLPRIDDSLDALSGAQWFSTLDLSSGYWQVEVAKEDRAKTAFITRSGLYEFCTMPFGLCNAPATFERLMELVLSGLQWKVCLIYLDDIIVYGSTFDDELQRLEVIFSRLRKANLKLKPKKCVLFQDSVPYLGYIVSRKGVGADPAKTEQINNWPVPRNVTEVRSFVGLCSYYRRFIEGFAHIASPLHALTKVGIPFDWTTECQMAFEMLKGLLTSPPILAYPDEKKPFILDTDASDVGIGAILSQVQGGQERVIAYASRSLAKAERGYCVTRKELLAVVYFVKFFKHYLYGTKFLLRTDHGSLRWLCNFRNPEGQIARWLEVLGTYDFEIQHRPGRQHGNADAMSRMPCPQCGAGVIDSTGDSKELQTKAKQMVKDNKRTNKVTAPIPGHDEVHTYVTKTPHVEDANKSWLEGWSNEKLHDLQLKDRNIQSVLAWLEGGLPRPSWEDICHESQAIKTLWSQWDLLKIHNGVLYRRWESEDGFKISWQLILPSELKKEVLQKLHDDPTAGHLGINRTLASVRARFFWYRMRFDVQQWVNKCDKCCSRKPLTKKKRAKLKQYRVGAPLERIAMDILGPLPQSHSGNKYILVIADYFTKWTEAYGMPNQEAKTVAEILVKKFICRFGTPRQLHTDQGRNFESLLMQEVCQLLGIDKTRTSPYHPESDGLVERFNRTVEAMLSLYVSENHRDWDEYLPCLMMAYRATPQESIQCTPNMLMLGREVEVPLDLMIGQPPAEMPTEVTEYAQVLREKMEKAHDYARQHLAKSAVRQKRYYDHKVKEMLFNRGDMVWLYTPAVKKGHSKKLQRYWTGPFAVVDRLSDTIYRIQKSKAAKPKVVHRNRLNKYTGDLKCAWLCDPLAEVESDVDSEIAVEMIPTEEDMPEVDTDRPIPENPPITNEITEVEGGVGDDTDPNYDNNLPSGNGRVDPRTGRPKRVRKPPDKFGQWTA